MKIINILHHSISGATADPIRSGSFEHYFAIELRRHYPNATYECWRPQRTLRHQVVYEDHHGITHRVFPSYYLCANVELSLQLLRSLKREPSDGSVGVIFHGAYNLHMCTMARIIANVPHILQSHGGFPAEVMMKRSSRKLLKVLYLLLGAYERRAFPLFKCVCAINSDEKRYLEELYHLQNVVWSPVGLDFERFRPLDRSSVRRGLGIPDATRMVLYVGRLAKDKGLFHLIDAFRLVHAGDRSATLYLVGDGPLEQQLRSYATAHGVPVTFAGRIDHSELPRWYSAADVFVMPSPIEWFGLSIAEALACGVPVVASRAGGAIDNVEIFQSGILVPPNDGQAIGRAIRKILTERVVTPNRERARAILGWDVKAPFVMNVLFGASSERSGPAPTLAVRST